MCQNRADLHKQTNETDKAEAEMSQILKSLDPETMEKIDYLLGQFSLAYEMQGFLYGLNFSRAYS